jgi:hypothetical protein
MINEYDHVRIKKNGITGVVVDLPRREGDLYYTVESDERGTPGGYGSDDSYKLYDCLAEELELI